ncbi:MAG: YfhO family protein [Bradyrhizobiaceae bacterium]|nr:YfhO family protein [Bradyrhizobiaceae bacterium]
MSKTTREWLICCGIILAVLFAFFGSALFTGKNFLSEGDNVAFYSFIPYLKAAKHAGEFPLWMPYIFSGMPSLASFLAAGDRTYDVASTIVMAIPRFVGEGAGNDTWRLVLWYGIYGIGVFSLLRSKKMEAQVALFSAVSAVLSTWVLVWIMIGHSTKPVSFATLPWILYALERLREKFSWQGMLVLTLAMIALVSATHPQMMFYMGCAAALYLTTELIVRLVRKQGPMDVLRAGGALVVATVLALGTHADMFLATREYTPYSTRGSAPLVQVKGSHQDQHGGNDYEYATNWSFSPEEMSTFFVPSFYGFGNTTVKMPGSAKEQHANLYWGQMPFTDAANYMGIGVLLLGILGAWSFRKDPFVIFLIVLSLFSLFLSFGKNMSFLYDVFYNYMPAFNKFRAPSMALCLLQFSMPVLAGYGLASVVSWIGVPERKRTATIIAGLCAAFLVVGLVYTSAFEDGYKTDVANAIVAKQPDRVKDASQISKSYLDVVYSQMRGDWLATGFIALGFGGMLFLMIRGTIKPRVGVPIIILLSVVDLWRVAAKPYDPKEGSPEKNVFRRTDVVDYIKKDNGVFRIADLSGLPANWWAYHFVENVHGYSSAKIRLYQDMLDVAAMGPDREPVPGNSIIINPFIWNLLNVKYIVSKQPVLATQPAFTAADGSLVYQNTNMLPRAWFVDSVVHESDVRTTLNRLRDGNFDPRTTAYSADNISITNGPGADACSASVTARGNESLTFTTQTDARRLMVVSEVYYPEWKCTVDGNEVPVHRVDFMLRGVVVPPGKHTVQFTFGSPAYEQGRTISLAANLFIALIAGGAAFTWWRGRKEQKA